jgi:metallo-beta-lactamase family protein
MVTIQFLGGVHTVTGSKFLITSDSAKILVDCGLYQGLKNLRERNWEKFPIDEKSINAVVLTHAHLDHCGYLPRLVKQGFQGKVHLTSDSAKLAEIILLDSAKMQEEDAIFASRKGFSRHKVPLPLYEESDAIEAISRFTSHRFHERVEIAPKVIVTFHRAGHILGSAIVELEIEDKRIIFSGDLGRPSHPILADPDPLPRDRKIDALLVESTYGDRRHLELSEPLADVITRTAKRGGSILIPAFAVDRTEIILHKLKELYDLQLVPRLPIYLDSPMALASLEVYRNAIARKSIDIDPKLKIEGDPFDSDFYQSAKSVNESKALADLKTSSIIISASGMATGGRVLHHLKNMLSDSRNTVVMVGYQSVGTRGRSLVDGADSIKIFGEHHKVLAEIIKINEFSVHADSEEMISWLAASEQAPGKIFIVHGESSAGLEFQELLHSRLGWKSEIPERLSIHAL